MRTAVGHDIMFFKQMEQYIIIPSTDTCVDLLCNSFDQFSKNRQKLVVLASVKKKQSVVQNYPLAPLLFYRRLKA